MRIDLTQDGRMYSSMIIISFNFWQTKDGRLCIFACDYFNLTPDLVGSVDAVYDRCDAFGLNISCQAFGHIWSQHSMSSLQPAVLGERWVRSTSRTDSPTSSSCRSCWGKSSGAYLDIMKENTPVLLLQMYKCGPWQGSSMNLMKFLPTIIQICWLYMVIYGQLWSITMYF